MKTCYCSTCDSPKLMDKVTIALYVFYKTWSSKDKRLLAAMVLLFILVIIRCFSKALALKGSSFHAMRKANSHKVNVVRGSAIREDVQSNQLFQFIQEAKEFMEDRELLRVVGFPSIPRMLFLDFPCSYSDRLTILRDFFWLRPESAYCAIERALSNMSSFLYTKEYDGPLVAAFSILILTLNNVPRKPLISVYKYLPVSAILATAFYFVGSSYHKQTYRGEVSKFTIFLVLGTALVEYIQPLSQLVVMDMFSGRILQRNLIGLFATNTRHSTLRRIAGWLQCKDLLDGFWGVEPSNSCKEITELVRLHVETGWKEYMVHLLSDNPEMLMPGSRKKLLETAYEELKVLLEGERTPLDEKELTRRVFEKCESAANLSQDTASLVGDAWELFQSLQNVHETKIWKLIQGVWVEMLCFSASRCRGYLHAEALGTGVEYLSYVWILLVYTGMETFAEKIQRREYHSFDSDESLNFGLAQEGGDAVTPLATRVKAPWISSLSLELSMVLCSLLPYASP